MMEPCDLEYAQYNYDNWSNINKHVCYLYECDLDESYFDEFDIIYIIDSETKDIIGFIECKK